MTAAAHGLLAFHLGNARVFYDLYLQNGKTYQFARLIWQENMAVLAVLPDCVSDDDIAQIAACTALSTHIKVWMSQFERAETGLSPGPDDVFAFATLVPFPRAKIPLIIGPKRAELA